MNRAVRLLYAALGCVFVALGVIGAFLPVMPTTVFLIAALWAFSLSSKRLETWLLEHPRFGPRLVEWRAHRVIPRGVKLTAWLSMAASFGIMVAVGVPWFGLAAGGGFMAIGAIHIASRPSAPTA